MKKINHIEEIKATRVGGFGGSDAAMVLAMAERIASGEPLTTAQKHRLLQLKGMETRPDFDSPEIQAGRAFEDEVAKRLDANEWDRETYLTPNPNSSQGVRQHFKVFAHADFVSMVTGTVRECKWSRKFDHSGLEKQYYAQLQWYYMLGARFPLLTLRDYMYFRDIMLSDEVYVVEQDTVSYDGTAAEIRKAVRVSGSLPAWRVNDVKDFEFTINYDYTNEL